MTTDTDRLLHAAKVTTPRQEQIDELRGLLDLLDGFASNDQRARFLLSCNFIRDNGAELAANIHRFDQMMSDEPPADGIVSALVSGPAPVFAPEPVRVRQARRRREIISRLRMQGVHLRIHTTDFPTPVAPQPVSGEARDEGFSQAQAVAPPGPPHDVSPRVEGLADRAPYFTDREVAP